MIARLWLTPRAPPKETLEFIRGTSCRRIAEIGIYEGYTSEGFARFLNGQRELHLFDFEDRVAKIKTG